MGHTERCISTYVNLDFCPSLTDGFFAPENLKIFDTTIPVKKDTAAEFVRKANLDFAEGRILYLEFFLPTGLTARIKILCIDAAGTFRHRDFTGVDLDGVRLTVAFTPQIFRQLIPAPDSPEFGY